MFGNADVSCKTHQSLQRKLLNEIKDWIFDIQNKPLPQNCRKQYLHEKKNIQQKEIIKKAPCNRIGAKTK